MRTETRTEGGFSISLDGIITGFTLESNLVLRGGEMTLGTRLLGKMLNGYYCAWYKYNQNLLSYSVDSDLLSNGSCYPYFEQMGPRARFSKVPKLFW